MLGSCYKNFTVITNCNLRSRNITLLLPNENVSTTYKLALDPLLRGLTYLKVITIICIVACLPHVSNTKFGTDLIGIKENGGDTAKFTHNISAENAVFFGRAAKIAHCFTKELRLNRIPLASRANSTDQNNKNVPFERVRAPT